MKEAEQDQERPNQQAEDPAACARKRYVFEEHTGTESHECPGDEKEAEGSSREGRGEAQ